MTTLHLALGQRCGLVTYHGPTANRVLSWGETDGFSWRSLQRALSLESGLSSIQCGAALVYLAIVMVPLSPSTVHIAPRGSVTIQLQKFS